MLRELHISNLAVISDARIELHAGLNCFTGATGAGKSLVIGALEVLLGLRSPAEMLRPGAEEGRVSGVFQVAGKEQLAEIERVTDVKIPGEDGGDVLLTRRLFSSGRSSISLNGNPITLSMLKQVSETLVDVHGQHDHQYLLKPSNQLDVLDQFGDLWGVRGRYHEVYLKLQGARQRVVDLAASRKIREQQLELYRFQSKEIDSAELDAGEYAEMSSRSGVLRNLEKLKKDASATHSALYEVDGSVVERVKTMSAVIAELSMLDPNLKNVAAGMKDAAINLEEVAYDLSRYLDKLDLDPAEAAEVEERLNTINRVLHKYGGSMEGTLAYREEIGGKVAEMEKATDDLASLEAVIPPLVKELDKLGGELSAKRQATAKRLSPLVESQLGELGMEKAKFSVAVVKLAEAGASGMDGVEFVVQTNPGLAAQPLRRIASGGEMSRIMLAMKGILAKSDRVSVLVFDEIDSNVGGRLGSIIGNKLRALAAHHQVLCITHLPQIACYGDRHLTVRKEVSGGKTSTSVRVMEGEERLQEVAEMIGGQRITDVTRAQAGELLEAARAEFGQKNSVLIAEKMTPQHAKRKTMKA